MMRYFSKALNTSRRKFMMENQINELFNLVTKCVTGIQRLDHDMQIVKTDVAELRSDVAELKSDTTELKEGQKRLEKEMVLVHKALDILSVDSVRIKARVDVLEEREFSN
jgi:chromosome segregation ATPase